MVHYWYYVSAGRQCDAQTKIYKVAVGTSVQSQRDFDFMLKYAQANKHFFEKVSVDSDNFIKRLRESLAEFNLQVNWISCRDFVKELRDTIATPLKSSMLSATAQQRTALNVDYRIFSNLCRNAHLNRQKTFPSAKRSTKKNLSI